MAIVTFYNGDPKDAPKTTMPAHLGANAIITCKTACCWKSAATPTSGGWSAAAAKMGDRAAGHRSGSL